MILFYKLGNLKLGEGIFFLHWLELVRFISGVSCLFFNLETDTVPLLSDTNGEVF